MFSGALILLLTAGSCVNSIDLIQTDSVVVQPGQTLSISCQVSGYSLTSSSYATGWIRHREGKTLEWICHRWGGGDFYQNDALKNKFLYYTNTSTSSVKLTGQNVQPEDTAVYYCARQGGGGLDYFDYWGKGTTVTVTSATTTGPSVFPLIQCGSGTGNLFTLGCLATGFTPSSLTFKWTKEGSTLTDFIQYPPVQKENAYTGVSQIQVSSQDWNNGQRFKCLVEHVGGNSQTTDIFKKPELYQLPSLKVYASTPSEVHNEASFSCYAKDFAPEVYTIKWLKNDVEIQDKPHVTPVEKKVLDNGTLYTVASFLTIKSDELANSKITCDFEGMAAQNVKGSVNASLIYQPPPPSDCSEVVDIQIIAPKMEDLFVNRKGSVVCQVRTLKPSVERIYWENQNGKEMATNPVPSSNGNTKSYRLSLDITFDEWSQGVELYCVVVHSEAIDPIKKLYQRIPEFLFGNFSKWVSDFELEDDGMGNTALTFILLFLFTLLFTIGTTAFKVK